MHKRTSLIGYNKPGIDVAGDYADANDVCSPSQCGVLVRSPFFPRSKAVPSFQVKHQIHLSLFGSRPVLTLHILSSVNFSNLKH